MAVKEKIQMKKYFGEAYQMYDWLAEHPEYKMVDYSFTFAYGYCLVYVEKQFGRKNFRPFFLLGNSLEQKISIFKNGIFLMDGMVTGTKKLDF